MTEQPVVEDRPPAGPPRWGLGDAAAGFVVAFCLTVTVGSIWAAATDRRQSLVLVAAGLVANWTGLLGAVLLASRRKGAGRLDEDFGLRMESSDVFLGVGAGVASQILVVVLYLPFRLLDPDLDVSDEARELTDLANGWGIVVLLAFVAVGSPLVEELFFRGLLLRALERRFGTAWAVGGSAVAFGLAHFQPVQLLGLVAFGAVLAVLAVRSGRLGPGLVAHATFNAITVLLLLL